MAKLYWFNKAADLGYADAQYSFGVLYVSGIGAPRDYDKARDLFAKAVSKKRQRAISTGLICFKGKRRCG